jgi:hypothetical protein
MDRGMPRFESDGATGDTVRVLSEVPQGGDETGILYSRGLRLR